MKERAKLEKGIRDQTQLANWKDANITAMRASAKKSHAKLFIFSANTVEHKFVRDITVERLQFENEGIFSKALLVCEDQIES